jgi:hypothetical protein
LFVELIDPPKTIRVPDLPENVVALTKTSKKIWCMLPDDMSVQITREQVLVLPNFAMTDYSSQGKTRAINVVDLNNCQSHFSYYTALSRSSTSAGTIILQGMDSRKITRGIHGSLRQEFRELEILNEITRLRYDGKLPLTVQGWNRREIIRAFRVWKGDTFSIGDVHPALQSVQGEDSFGDHAVSTGRWQLVGSDVTTKPKQNESSPISYKKTQLSMKRKRMGGSKPAPRKKGKTADPIPLGLKWDCVNYSCAYDALFTCMYNIWLDHGPKWSDRFKAINVNVETLGTGFEAVAHKTRSLETVRDQLRANLYNALPANFPMGPVYTYLDKLTDAMFGDSFWGVDTMKCLGCGYIGGQTQGFSCTRTIYKDIILSQQFKHEYRISNWINSLKLSRGNGTCRTCNRQLAIIQHIEKSPPLFYLAVDDPTIRFDTALHIKVSGNSVRYALRGVIYSGQNHFAARIVKEDGAMWYHDGIETGATTVYEGSVHTQNSSFLNTCRRAGIVRNACGVIYAIVD